MRKSSDYFAYSLDFVSEMLRVLCSGLCMDLVSLYNKASALQGKWKQK